jgi:hypothetical protein
MAQGRLPFPDGHDAARAFFFSSRVGELLRAHGSVFRFIVLTAFMLI